MAAGVHASLHLGLEGQIVLLGDGQSVHVAADEDGLAGLRALDGGEHAGAERAALHIGDADLVKLLHDELAGLELLGAQLRILVDLSADLHDIVAVFLRAFLNVQNDTFLRNTGENQNRLAKIPAMMTEVMVTVVKPPTIMLG